MEKTVRVTISFFVMPVKFMIAQIAIILEVFERKDINQY